MSTSNAKNISGDAIRPRNRPAAPCVSGWLGLAASPIFALMAWISANDGLSMMCSSAPGMFPIGGMAWMYLLMSLFHLSPWLKLASARSGRPTSQFRGD